MNIREKKVAIVTDWLTTPGGAEKVLESLEKIFPNAEFFTSVYIPENFPFLKNKKVHTTYLQKLPKRIRARHQILFPLLPKAMESINCNKFDLVISSSTFVAKSVITNENTPHLCYCHTPTRYFWDEWQYFMKEGLNIPKFLRFFDFLFPPLFTKLRQWDFVSAQRPDAYIGNSEYVQKRIEKYYRRDSNVLRPPVDYKKFTSGLAEKKQDYYVAVGRLIPYKKFDLLIRAFQEMPEKKLKIAGKGPEIEYLQNIAHNAKNIEFLGFVPDEKLPQLVGKAKAYLFPQNEDAGITPMEALCTGTPVIAFQKGGAIGMIHEGENGIFFKHQSIESIKNAVNKFEGEEKNFKRKKISSSMEQYSVENFEKNFLQRVEEFLKD